MNNDSILTGAAGSALEPHDLSNAEGMLEQGNIDPYSRKVEHRADGSIATVESFSVNMDGMEVLLPSVIDGKTVSMDDAIRHYEQTGEHLGKFDTPEHATAYAQKFHENQAAIYGRKEQGWRAPMLPPTGQMSWIEAAEKETRDAARRERVLSAFDTLVTGGDLSLKPNARAEAVGVFGEEFVQGWQEADEETRAQLAGMRFNEMIMREDGEDDIDALMRYRDQTGDKTVESDAAMWKHYAGKRKVQLDEAETKRANALALMVRLVRESDEIHRAGDANWKEFEEGMEKGAFDAEDEERVMRAQRAFSMFRGMVQRYNSAGADVQLNVSTAQLIRDAVGDDAGARALFFAAVQDYTTGMQRTNEEKNFLRRFGNAFIAGGKTAAAGAIGTGLHGYVTDAEVDEYERLTQDLKERPAVYSGEFDIDERVTRRGALAARARESGQLVNDAEIRRLSGDERREIDSFNAFRAKMYKAVNGMYEGEDDAAWYHKAPGALGKMVMPSAVFLVPGGAAVALRSQFSEQLWSDLGDEEHPRTYNEAEKRAAVSAVIGTAVEKIAFGSLNPLKMSRATEWVMKRGFMTRALGGFYGTTGGRVALVTAGGVAEETFAEPAAQLVLEGAYNALAPEQDRLDPAWDSFKQNVAYMCRPENVAATVMYGLFLGGATYPGQKAAADDYRETVKRLCAAGVSEADAAIAARIDDPTVRKLAAGELLHERYEGLLAEGKKPLDALSEMGCSRAAELADDLKGLSEAFAGRMPRVVPVGVDAKGETRWSVTTRDEDGKETTAEMSDAATHALLVNARDELVAEEQGRIADLLLGSLKQEGHEVQEVNERMDGAYFARLARLAKVKLGAGADENAVDADVHPFLTLGQAARQGEAWQRRMDVARHETEQREGRKMTDAEWTRRAKNFASRVNRTRLGASEGRLRTLFRVVRGEAGATFEDVWEDVVEEEVSEDMERNGRELGFYVRGLQELERAMGREGEFLRALKDGEEYNKTDVLEAMGRAVRGRVLADTAARGRELPAWLGRFLDMLRRWSRSAKALFDLGRAMNEALKPENADKVDAGFRAALDELTERDTERLRGLQDNATREAQGRVSAAVQMAAAGIETAPATPIMDAAEQEHGEEVRKEEQQRQERAQEMAQEIAEVEQAARELGEDGEEFSAQAGEMPRKVFEPTAINPEYYEMFNKALNGGVKRSRVITVMKMPIVLRAALGAGGHIRMQGDLFQKMAGKHDFSQEAFAAFPESLFDPIGVFYDRTKKNHVVIIDVKVPNQEGVIKNAMVAIEVKADKNGAEVCDIITAFSPNKSDYLKKFISSPLYVDKKRAEVWAGAEEGNILQLLSTALSELGSEVIMRDKLAEVNDKIYQISHEDDIQFAERLRVAVASLGNDGFMKAPNGVPSKLTPNQWTQVRTPEFKAWFGDWENDPKNASKVLDENGEPRVVYHITDGEFTVFDLAQARQSMDIPAFFFSSGTEDWADMGSRVMACFLNIRNPKEGKPIVRGNGREVREQLVAEGYDGTIDADEDVEEVEYAAFHPNQIKSATENRGTYSALTDDITMSVTEEAADSLGGMLGDAGVAARSNGAFVRAMVAELRQCMERARAYGAATKGEREAALVAMGSAAQLVTAATAFLPKGYRVNVQHTARQLQVLAELATSGEVDFTRELASQDLKRFAARTKRRLDKRGLDAVEQVMDDKRMEGIELPEDAALDDILKEFGKQRFMAVFEKLVDDVTTQLRRHAKDKVVERMRALLERVRPKRDSKTGSMKNKGGMSAEANREMELIEAAMEMNAETLQTELAGLAAKEAAAETEEAAAKIQERMAIFSTFGNMDGMSYENAQGAYEALLFRVRLNRFAWDDKMARQKVERNMAAAAVVDGLGRAGVNEYHDVKVKKPILAQIKDFPLAVASLPHVLYALQGVPALKPLMRQLARRCNEAGENVKIWDRDRWRRLEMMSRATLGKSWRRAMNELHEQLNTGVAFDKPIYREFTIRTAYLRELMAMSAAERAEHFAAAKREGGLAALTLYSERDIKEAAAKLADMEADGSERAEVKVKYVKEMKHEDDLRMSRGEALYIILMFEQPTYTERMIRQGYTFDVIEGLRDFVGRETYLKFGYGLRELFAEQGKKLAKVYEDVYGVPFPHEQNYFAARWLRHGQQDSTPEALLGGMTGQPGAATGFLKPRVDHDLEIDTNQDAVSVFLQSTRLSDCWMATQGVVADMRALMRNREFAEAMTAKLGAESYGNLRDWVNVMEGANMQEVVQMKGVEELMRRAYGSGAITMLGFALRTMIRQTPAFFNGLLGSADISTVEWLTAMFRMKRGEAPMTFKRMRKSVFMQQRRAGDVAELQRQATETEHKTPWVSELLQVAMAPMEKLDAFWTAQSLVPVWNVYYSRARDAGMSKDDAEKEAWEQTKLAANMASQPIGWLNKSKWVQKRNPLVRSMFYMLSEDVNKTALCWALLKNGNKGAAARAWIVYGAANAVVSAILDCWTGDPKDWEKAHWWEYVMSAIYGPLASMPCVGELMEELGHCVLYGAGSLADAMGADRKTVKELQKARGRASVGRVLFDAGRTYRSVKKVYGFMTDNKEHGLWDYTKAAKGAMAPVAIGAGATGTRFGYWALAAAVIGNAVDSGARVYHNIEHRLK